MADKSRDISAVIDLRGGSDRVNAGVTDSASDTDGAILGSSSREAISVADRTDVTAAALTVASAANDGPANARPANDGPANARPANDGPSKSQASSSGSSDGGASKAAAPGPGQNANASGAYASGANASRAGASGANASGADTSAADTSTVPDTSGQHAAPPTVTHRAIAGPTANPARPAPAAAPPNQAAPTSAPSRRSGNRLFGALAAVSIAAAAISLTAPALRPEFVRLSDILLGADNPVAAWLLPPAPPVDLERDLAALVPRVAQLEAGLRGVSGELRRLDTRLAEAGSTFHEGLGSIDSIARMAQDALRRTEGIEAASQDLTNRIRATGLLALATRLRRDIDVGAPLAENALLLALYGPYPPAVERAIEDLTRMPDGALTMRDLAAGFEALEARIQAVAGLDSSWSARGWNRVRSLFGAEPTDLEAAIGERLHALAGEGRFTEAADLLERSPWKELGAAWIGQVRDRASAARAAQLVMAHAVAMTRATQGATQAGAAQAGTARAAATGATQSPTPGAAPQATTQRTTLPQSSPRLSPPAPIPPAPIPPAPVPPAPTGRTP